MGRHKYLIAGDAKVISDSKMGLLGARRLTISA